MPPQYWQMRRKLKSLAERIGAQSVWSCNGNGCSARKITFVLSVSDSYNRANVRQSTDDSLAMLRDVLAERDNRQNIKVATALATSFGCSIEGAVASEARVTQITEILAKQGIDEINLADTVGYGDPAQVGRIFTDVQNAVGELLLAAHFHDTRGLGLANVMAALDAGVRRFDSALGGLGDASPRGRQATSPPRTQFICLTGSALIRESTLAPFWRYAINSPNGCPEKNWRDGCLAQVRPTDNPSLASGNRW